MTTTDSQAVPKRRRRTSQEVLEDRIRREVAEIDRLLQETAATMRFLLKFKLVERGIAKDLREADAIVKDEARLEAVLEASE